MNIILYYRVSRVRRMAKATSPGLGAPLFQSKYQKPPLSGIWKVVGSIRLTLKAKVAVEHPRTFPQGDDANKVAV
jgi:hypothetical protein